MHASAAHPATASRSGALSGRVRVPGDKSISHRALLLGSQVIGTVRISGLLEGEDVLNTARALQALGVPITRTGENAWQVEGVGIGGLKESAEVLDMGNSGTGARLLMGLVASYPFTTLFTGDASLCRRPMGRVIAPLSEMGAQVASREGGKMPLAVHGAERPLPITYSLPVASAQVKSAVLLAGLNTPGATTVIEPEPSRDHTENMLRHFGFPLTREGHAITLSGQVQPPRADHTLTIPADPSSAAFPLVAALVVPGSSVVAEQVCINPLRTGLFLTLKEMGAALAYENEREVCGERVADIRVSHSSLRGVRVPASRAPSMIDEYIILAVAAAFAEGETIMEGLAELRVKESDRLAATLECLTACGVEARIDGDTLRVIGQKRPKGGATIRTQMDHRLAMSFLVMGLGTEAPVIVDDITPVSTSFPGFVVLMQRLGGNITANGKHAPRATPLVIAIDGPAASGKGTLARRLAAAFDLAYLDTGSLYRAVGLKLHYSGHSPHDAEAALAAARSITVEDLANPRLRQEHVGQAASVVSAMPEVRQALLEFQRSVAKSGNGAVLDGRDIGTVVCPEAPVKFYLTAGIDARAKRRHRELQGQGIQVVFASVKEDLEERDARDAARSVAPMKPASDAIVLDTSILSADDVFAWAHSEVQKRVG